MHHGTSGSSTPDAVAQSRLKRAAVGVVKHHLSPLGLIEAAGFVTALALGWSEVAAVILSLHVARMALMVVRDLSGNRTVPNGSEPSGFSRVLELTGHGSLGHSHGLGHGWSHGLGHGWSHGLGHRLSHTLDHRK